MIPPPDPDYIPLYSKRQVTAFWIGLVLLLVAVGGGVVAYLMMDHAERTAGANAASAVLNADSNAINPDKLRPGDYMMGNPKAKVVLFEYASLSCLDCATWHKDVLPRLKTAFIDTGDLLYVYRFFLLDRYSRDPDAARLAMCVPRSQFFSFIDMMYRRQPEWDQSEYPVIDPVGALVRMGTDAGLSRDAAKACIAPNLALDHEISTLAAAADTRYDIGWTPVIVIDGYAGPKDHMLGFDEISFAVNNALKKAALAELAKQKKAP